MIDADHGPLQGTRAGTNMDSGDADSRLASVVTGLIVMGVGLLLLLGRLDMIELRFSARLIWPFVVLALGIARLLDPGRVRGRPRSRRSGAWLVWIGLWGFVTEFHVFGLDYDTSWPLLIVGVGLGIVWRAFEYGRGGRTAGRSQP